jgi:GDP/UDP-N,N'-diacetylbacillosamine 2-epimerase (hydrolysing)
MKVGILTSSRADYGIYRPLLKLLQEDNYFEMEIIAFGTHLLEKYGKTLNHILEDGYKVVEVEGTIPSNDSPKDISNAIGKAISHFSDFWNTNKFDLILALGDRYEMFSAVTSALPFNQIIAHIHGGETTLGAIDNSFRHSITLMAKLHFAAANEYKNRIINITGTTDNVYSVGALSIDNIKQLKLLSIEEINETFKINLNNPSILFTFHPETIDFEKNAYYINEVIACLEKLNKYQIIITMPNSDTMGLHIRKELNKFIDRSENAIGIESFGSLGYLSVMKHCTFMMGNTSSGFIEAAGLNIPVVNLGNRQKGRIVTPNIFNTNIEQVEIIKAVELALKYKRNKTINIYGDGNAAKKIVEIIKNYANKFI